MMRFLGRGRVVWDKRGLGLGAGWRRGVGDGGEDGDGVGVGVGVRVVQVERVYGGGGVRGWMKILMGIGWLG